MKNKTLWVLIGLTGVIYSLKWLMGITLLRDQWYNFLIAVDLIAVFMKLLKMDFLLRRTAMFLCVIAIVMSLVGGSMAEANYNYMYTPDSKQRLILQEYSKNIRKDGYLAIYKKHFVLFKKQLGDTIMVRQEHPLMTGKLAQKERQVFGGDKTYTIGKLKFNWSNNKTLNVQYSHIDQLEAVDQKFAQTIVEID